MSNPLVSILITSYNREKYIAECIESVLASTFSDYEIIIVDNCSTDNTFKICQDYVPKDNRIKLFQNETNIGQFPNRNKAAEYASGKYIKYLDSDDLIYPHGLEIMVNSISKFPDAGLAVSYPKPEDAKPYPFMISPQEAYIEQFLGSGVMDIGPSSTIILKEAFDKVQGFRTDMDFLGNDLDLWFRISALYPIVKMPTSLIWWRQHEEQLFNNADKEYMINNLKFIINTLSSETCPLNYDLKKKAIARNKHNYSRKLLSILIKERNFSLAKQMFNNSPIGLLNVLKAIKPYR